MASEFPYFDTTQETWKCQCGRPLVSVAKSLYKCKDKHFWQLSPKIPVLWSRVEPLTD